MSNIQTWFTADQHFGHANIIRYCARPFNSVDDMDTTLIRNWNKLVGQDDVVYHLGDFTLGNVARFAALAANLNGRIHVVPGSHDERWLDGFHNEIPSRSGHFVQLLPPLVSIRFPERGAGRRSLIVVLCHYAMRVWERAHYGAWHLYGHSHGRLPPEGRSLDVGVDCHNYCPISFDAIAERMPPVVSKSKEEDM
jgi:calcineurin-like phosphoesterase family protein